MADERTGGSFTSDEREDFYFETLNDARFECPMLHDPLWVLNVRYPCATQDERERLAEATLLALLDGGFIELFPEGDKVPLHRDRARSVILGATWRGPAAATVYEFSTTPEGEKAHHRVPDATWDRLFPDRNLRPSKPDLG